MHRLGVSNNSTTESTRVLLSFIVFFLAGAPSLIYQVVWQRVLSQYFGVDIYSTTISVTIFMLGLGLGSMIGGYLGDRSKSIVRLYSIVEILIGCFGFISLQLFAFVGSHFAGSSVVVFIVLDSLMLLVPTILMGMTLPLMSRLVIRDNNSIGKRISILYGLNTLGAAIGALLSAYLLIGTLGLNGAVYLAGITNCLLGLFMYLFLYKRLKNNDLATTYSAPDQIDSKQLQSKSTLSYKTVLLCSFLSGFVALGYEIVWYRVSGLLLHGTVYVFGSILFIFLIGIAVGSLASNRTISKPGWAERFATCQLYIAGYVFVSFSILGHFSSLPGLRHLISASFFTYFHPSLELISGELNPASLYSAADIVFWLVAILFIPTFYMGYGFPNLIREGSRSMHQLGQSIGNIYFANIIGSATGSLITGFVLLHYLGTERTLQLMIISGCFIYLLVSFNKFSASNLKNKKKYFKTVLSVLIIILTMFSFPERLQIIKAIHFADYDSVEFEGYEDRSGVAALRKQHAIISFKEETKILGQQRLLIDGSTHGAVSKTLNIDKSIQVALSAHEKPKRVLLIGLGDGTMASVAAANTHVESLSIVELNNSLWKLLEKTPSGNFLLTKQDKLKYIIDDGRRWLLANPNEYFDVIMMWPLHAAHSFSGSLYSVEFLSIISNHLNNDGIFISKSADYFSTPKSIAYVFNSVIRIKNQTYVAGNSPIKFSSYSNEATNNEIMELITANEELIIQETREANLNYDLHPNSEYYITYPYTKYMSKGKNAPYFLSDYNKKNYLRSP